MMFNTAQTTHTGWATIANLKTNHSGGPRESQVKIYVFDMDYLVSLDKNALPLC